MMISRYKARFRTNETAPILKNSFKLQPKKLNDSTKPQDVEYEYVLTSGTEDDKPPREINVSEENKFNTLHEAEQNNEIAQADQAPVSVND